MTDSEVNFWRWIAKRFMDREVRRKQKIDQLYAWLDKDKKEEPIDGK